VTLSSALVIGAQGRLGAATLSGFVLGGLILLSAAARAFAGAMSSAPAPGAAAGVKPAL
jgi:hypothetical protein